MSERQHLMGDAVHGADFLLSLVGGDTATALWALAQAMEDGCSRIIDSDRASTLKRMARVWVTIDVAAQHMPPAVACDIVNNVATAFYEGTEAACRARHFEGRIRHRIKHFGMVLEAPATPAIVAEIMWEAWRRG